MCKVTRQIEKDFGLNTRLKPNGHIEVSGPDMHPVTVSPNFETYRKGTVQLIRRALRYGKNGELTWQKVK